MRICHAPLNDIPDVSDSSDVPKTGNEVQMNASYNTLIGSDPVKPSITLRGLLKSLALKIIKEERDIDLLTTLIKLSILLPASAIGIFFWPEPYVYYAGAAHIVIYLIYLGPFILMLHNISHRPLFRHSLKFLNAWPHTLLGVLFGQSPGTYFSHHLGMHHPENNLETDLSSTMKYRRDSFLHFMHYFLSFFFLGIITLGIYFIRKERYKFLVRILLGELTWYAIAIALFYLNSAAAIFTVIAPFVLTRFLMMAGNWTQHAFVDLSDPDNPYLNSITFIDSPYNKRCFNDGYHIGHHVLANRHFLDMPTDFLANIETYRRNKSIVFKKLDYFMIWFLLMTKSYKTLSKFFVSLEEKPVSQEQIIQLMKSRMTPLKEFRKNA